jgi:hypothetical protein
MVAKVDKIVDVSKKAKKNRVKTFHIPFYNI